MTKMSELLNWTYTVRRTRTGTAVKRASSTMLSSAITGKRQLGAAFRAEEMVIIGRRLSHSRSRGSKGYILPPESLRCLQSHLRLAFLVVGRALPTCTTLVGEGACMHATPASKPGERANGNPGPCGCGMQHAGPSSRRPKMRGNGMGGLDGHRRIRAARPWRLERERHSALLWRWVSGRLRLACACSCSV